MRMSPGFGDTAANPRWVNSFAMASVIVGPKRRWTSAGLSCDERAMITLPGSFGSLAHVFTWLKSNCLSRSLLTSTLAALVEETSATTAIADNAAAARREIVIGRSLCAGLSVLYAVSAGEVSIKTDAAIGKTAWPE